MGALGKMTVVAGGFILASMAITGVVSTQQRDNHVNELVEALEMMEIKNPGSQMWGWADTDVPLSVPYPVLSEKLGISPSAELENVVVEYIPQHAGHHVLRIVEPANLTKELLYFGDTILYEHRTDES